MGKAEAPPPSPPPPHAPRTHRLTGSLALNAAAKNMHPLVRHGGPAGAGSEQPSPRGGLEIEAGIWGNGNMTRDGQKAQWFPARLRHRGPRGRHCLPLRVQTWVPPGSPICPGSLGRAGAQGSNFNYSGAALSALRDTLWSRLTFIIG